MDQALEVIIGILEQSVKKNGEKPLTNKWLLNVLKLADKKLLEDENNHPIDF